MQLHEVINGLSPFQFSPENDKLQHVAKVLNVSESMIFTLGNGGSAAIASHFANDLMKIGIPAISLDSVPTLTCFANDYGYANVFSQQITHLTHPKIYRNPPRVVLFSSSGESTNILETYGIASLMGAITISFTGFDFENTLKSKTGYSIWVDSKDYGVVESIHSTLCHYIISLIKEVTT